MDWIKKNYDRFTLAIFSVALVAASVMLFLNTSNFGERFAAAIANPPHNNVIPAMDTAVIDTAKKQLESPVIWKERDTKKDQNGGLVFTSERYQELDGKISKIGIGENWSHSRLKLGIPNDWVLENSFSVLDEAQAKQDPDGDGFWNEDEWLYHTDPNKKDSHPPYYAALYLAKFVPQAFRLKFQSYDGNPKTDPPEKMEFQINALDTRAATQFVKLNDQIAGTKFKVIKFQFKEELNKGTGEMQDVSELTVRNLETDEDVILILDKIVDSPNKYAVFGYYLVGKDLSDGVKPLEIPVLKTKEFVLRPDATVKYKLLDVNKERAVIQLPDGKFYSVYPYPGKKPEENQPTDKNPVEKKTEAKPEDPKPQ